MRFRAGLIRVSMSLGTGGSAMRLSGLLRTLAVVITLTCAARPSMATLVHALPAGSPLSEYGAPPAEAAVFSLFRAARLPRGMARAVPAVPAQRSTGLQLFGYPAAQAEEFRLPQPDRPTEIFSHAALGVAALDVADGDQTLPAPHEANENTNLPLAAAELNVPSTRLPTAPSPLPLPVVLLLVLVPAGLVLAQVLFGSVRTPRRILRHRHRH